LPATRERFSARIGRSARRFFLVTIAIWMANTAASPLGLPTLEIPSANPQTSAKIALGERLFHDRRLSKDGRISCASCHQPQRAFTDGCKVSVGAAGLVGTRNAPSLLNAAFSSSQFWDGRRQTLEEQAKEPFFSPNEHGLVGPEELLLLIKADVGYVSDFLAVFGSDIVSDGVAKALAAFQRTLIAGESAFDRHYYGGDRTALSLSAARGLALFKGRARCAECHTIGERHALFTDHKFHSVSVGRAKFEKSLASTATRVARMDVRAREQLLARDPEISQLGRFVVTLNPRDIGGFRTPSLRNVAETAPYMHDGSVETLEAAVEVEIYYRGIEAGRPLVLTPQEKADIVEFLKALSSPLVQRTAVPMAPVECP
jgi:cytochrome c peroxidase